MNLSITRRNVLQSLALGSASVLLHRAQVLVKGAEQKYTLEQIGMTPMKTLKIGGLEVQPSNPPKGIVHRPDLGLLVSERVTVQRIHASLPDQFAEAPRAVITPLKGDYLTIFPAGTGHQWGAKTKRNEMVAYRSKDKGKTWQGPTNPWKVPYNQHAFNPLIPRGSKRIYTFGLEQPFESMTLMHSGPIAMRYSDDDGHTWSEPKRVVPTNDPEYQGVAHMQMCETEAGTWLLGTYTVNTFEGGMRSDRQRVLRSEDQGKTWTIVPGPEHGGWFVKEHDRMLEGKIISLGGKRAVMFARVPSGHLWEMRTEDDGKTWSAAKETVLVHPDAPPMIFKLADKKTLVAFIHNKPSSNRGRDGNFSRGPDRQELWCSLSLDEGKTWSDARFLMADAAIGKGMTEVGYADLIVVGTDLQLLVNHKKHHVVLVRFKQSDLSKLPTRADLARNVKA